MKGNIKEIKEDFGSKTSNGFFVELEL